LKKTNPDFECVFVSSDKDEAAFKEYYAEMSFLSLPFSERELKAKLSKKYKVSGIPSLIILGADGEIITANGRNQVMEDPSGKKFPWKPKTFEQILPAKLTSKDGEEAVDSSSLDRKHLMLYFVSNTHTLTLDDVVD
jgi:nucleoredoxin